ncbi:MAG: LacI family transcriptional regulator [Clostridiales bacterium]|nr:LacI family transcriptional regulator [Clostridiales bacterium]
MLPKKKTTKPRIIDIAQAAGVSVATASNVLSERRQVNSDAGRRVMEIAKEMGYTRTQKSTTFRKTIHFIIYKKHGKVVMDTPFFFEMIAGIEQACRDQNYELYTSYLNMSDAADLKERVQAVLYDKSTAVLLLGTEMNDEDLAPFLQASVPLVVVDSHFQNLNVNTVVIDNHRAAYIATNHLIQSGHTRIGCIGSSIPFHNMRDRYAGYQSALRDAGLSIDPTDMFYVEPTTEGALRDMKQILAERTTTLPTAFFSANDIMAVSAARAMISVGMHLPQDASIIGMDDVPLCQIINPPLSTIRVPKAAIGATAVHRLIKMIEQPDGIYIKSFVGVSLVERDSVLVLKSNK